MQEISGRMTKLEEKTKLEIGKIKRENKILKVRIDELEQYGMKCDVIICGINDSKDETEEELIKKVIEVTKKLNTNLTPQKIVAIHRLPTRKKTNSHPVAVRLNTLRKKTDTKETEG